MEGSLALMIVLIVVAVLSFVAGIVWLTTEHQRKMAQIKERSNPGANPEIQSLRTELAQLQTVRQELAELKTLLHRQIIATDSLQQLGWLNVSNPVPPNSTTEEVAGVQVESN